MTKLDHYFHKHSPVCWNIPFWCYKWREQNSASFNFKIVSAVEILQEAVGGTPILREPEGS